MDLYACDVASLKTNKTKELGRQYKQMLPDSLVLAQLIKGFPLYLTTGGFMDRLSKILEGTHLKAMI